MERIKQAIELAKTKGATLGGSPRPVRAPLPLSHAAPNTEPEQVPVAPVDERHLEAMRVVSHQSKNPMAIAFDVLRTSVLREMSGNNWRMLAVSSPTQGCGKTVTAINLALSLARQPDRHVVLVDLDMRRPSVASYLGIEQKYGLLEALSGTQPLAKCMTHLNIASSQFSVISNRRQISNPAEVIASKEMASLFSLLKNDPRRPFVILDTSPMLVCDDVMAMLPLLDCLLLTVAEGHSTSKDVSACERVLQSTNYLGIVLTKSHETTENYYY